MGLHLFQDAESKDWTLRGRCGSFRTVVRTAGFGFGSAQEKLFCGRFEALQPSIHLFAKSCLHAWAHVDGRGAPLLTRYAYVIELRLRLLSDKALLDVIVDGSCFEQGRSAHSLPSV